MAIPIPRDVRQLLDAPNYVHLSTLRADGSPRNWVVWVGLEGDHILVCTSDAIWKAKDMRRDPRVALSVTDTANPYRMAAIQGRVVEVPTHRSRTAARTGCALSSRCRMRPAGRSTSSTIQADSGPGGPCAVPGVSFAPASRALRAVRSASVRLGDVRVHPAVSFRRGT